MQSFLPRWAWVLSIAAYGILAAALYVFTKAQVAPCFDGVGPAALERQRAEQWFANRPIWEKLIDSRSLRSRCSWA
jgi:hypothetical protein